MFLDQGNSEQRQPGVTYIISLCCTHTTVVLVPAARGRSQGPWPLIMFTYRERVSGFHRIDILRTSYTDARLRHSQPASSSTRGWGQPPPPANVAAAAQAQAIAPNSPIQPFQG